MLTDVIEAGYLPGYRGLEPGDGWEFVRVGDRVIPGDEKYILEARAHRLGGAGEWSAEAGVGAKIQPYYCPRRRMVTAEAPKPEPEPQLQRDDEHTRMARFFFGRWSSGLR